MPLSDALGSGGVGITPAYSTLKHIVGKTAKIHQHRASSSSKRHQRRHHPYDNNSYDTTSETAAAAASNTTKWMTLDKIDPERYYRRKIVGRGDLMTQFNNQVQVIGEKSQYGDPTVPEFKQRGPRRLGGNQPGSEMLNFYPMPTIYALVKAVQILRTRPTNITNPGFDETIQLNIEQQPGIFMDGRVFVLEAELQMYYKDVPWETPTTGLGVKYRKMILPVNNVLPSLFKSVIVTANNQPVITYECSTTDYMRTVFQSTLPPYKNGELSVQGFFKETAGHLAEYDGLTEASDDNTPPTNSKNQGRQELLRMFWKGQKVKLRANIRFPITEALDKTPLNSANRIGFTFQRNPNTFYQLSAPENASADPKDCATKAVDCKIRINELKIKTRMLEYDKPVLERYVNTYTDQFPDTYLFTFHQIHYHSYQSGDLFYQIQVTTDTVPDRLAFALRHKEARLGNILLNQYILYRLPAGTKWQITVNDGAKQFDPFENTYDQYEQMREALNRDTQEPLISYYDYMVNDESPTSDCQYNLYCDTLTMTQKNEDGSIAQDTRQAAVTIKLMLQSPNRLPANMDLMINKYDIRRLAIQNEGIILKNYPQ